MQSRIRNSLQCISSFMAFITSSPTIRCDSSCRIPLSSLFKSLSCLCFGPCWNILKCLGNSFNVYGAPLCSATFSRTLHTIPSIMWPCRRVSCRVFGPFNEKFICNITRAHNRITCLESRLRSGTLLLVPINLQNSISNSRIDDPPKGEHAWAFDEEQRIGWPSKPSNDGVRF